MRFTKRIRERLRELQAERDQHYSGPFSNPEFVDVKPGAGEGAGETAGGGGGGRKNGKNGGGEEGKTARLPSSRSAGGIMKLKALTEKATSEKDELDASDMTVEEMTRILSFQSRWGIIYETYRPKSFYYGVLSRLGLMDGWREGMD